MERVIKACLRYPALTVVLTLMLVAVGARALMYMPRTEDPSITIRTGLVLAMYPGATSEQVQQQVTRTLESTIFKFQEVRKAKTFSTSRPGLAIINVELEKNVKNPDLFWAKLRNEMLVVRATSLPREVMGPIVNSDFGDTVAMLVAVSGERYGYRELLDYVDRIKDSLRTVPQVGKIATYGQQSEQIWLTSSLERMSQYFTDPLRVIGALSQRNVVLGAGSVSTPTGKVPLHTTGVFNTEDEIRKVMVGMSPMGQPIYIGDFAQVERRYQDPEFLVRFDGHPALMISVEMQKGNNIVELGERIAEKFDALKPMLPPDLHLDFVADQPRVVEERIAGMGHEFLIAIACVVLVTVLLLPMRVALIAAMAIPVTMLCTVGVMSALGIQLHQVSIAALILVLGIVVDDAIVIADNYVELLDHHVPRAEAAWRCAHEVMVPVLAATLTIVASFLPLTLLSGSSGEFILALPITVAVALSVSFIVALFLTPLLCRTFILKGLHDPDAQAGPSKFNILDLLQAAYIKGITTFMARPRLAMGLGAGAIAMGILLFGFVGQQFFPNAERNQFVIDLWMPQGTRIEATDAALRRVEADLAANGEVAHYATFLGQSAPRFYYNVNPQQPDPAYAQLIVNTHHEKATGALVAALQTRLARLVPEGLVIVKELQQGAVMEAPVEIRLSGEDTAQLKALGAQVEDILRADARSRFVSTDHYNDSAMVNVELSPELANRLGMTYAEVSQLLSGAFDGTPVSTFWEGDRAVHIVLRVDPAHRQTFDDVRDTYLASPVAHGRVPLRAIASLAPVWQTSRIVRRNGVPTLTVRSFAVPGVYASNLLKAVLPRIKALPLPAGYRLELGGERENQGETFPEMIMALSVSLLAIFLILMIQFRNLTEPLVVMASIPLSLFGVVAGLLLTGNAFGFTAFMGMIALCGIVVRNAIILIDFIKEKRREGLPLQEAAMLAGERRLRPIFLTTMAAAVGVTPMILSGSKLWSPLASVLAVGLIFSMFFTLLVVPVLYVLVFTPRRGGGSIAPALLALLFLGTGTLAGQGAPRPLTLEEAVQLALRNSPGTKIARAKLEEAQAKRRTARADYFPQLSADATWMQGSGEELIHIPAGGLGTLPGIGAFPTGDLDFGQGNKRLYLQNFTLGQPLTQLYKIHQGNQVATAEERRAQAELRQMEGEIAFKTRQAYAGLLIARARLQAAQAGVAAATLQGADAQEAVKAGNALPVLTTGSRAQLAKARHQALTAESGAADLTAELDDLLGLPQETPLEPAAMTPRDAPLPTREALLAQALEGNPDLAAAAASLDMSQSALKARWADYVPDISAFARQTHQDGVPFLRPNTTSVGLTLSWSIFDWGKRQGQISQRAAVRTQAEENRQRLRHRVEIDLGKLLRKVATAQLLLEAAEEGAALNQEKARLASNQRKAGLIPEGRRAEAEAEALAAAADLLAARLGLDLAHAELDQLLGKH
jgi:multidrug efflux pump subunit AcrB/outer membrane protein TolC